MTAVNKIQQGAVVISLNDLGGQEALVSGTNIKTINNESLLGSGNITVGGGGATKSIMTGMMNANYTLSKTNATKLTLVANKSVSIGTGLSISDGGIKIGAGITKVLVNAQIHFAEGGTGSSRRGVQIFKNSSNIAYCNINNVRTYTGASISPLLLTVVENDIIYLYGLNQGQTGSQIQASNSWLTVQVVE